VRELLACFGGEALFFGLAAGPSSNAAVSTPPMMVQNYRSASAESEEMTEAASTISSVVWAFGTS